MYSIHLAQYMEDMMVDSCESGNIISDCIRGREYFDYLSEYCNFACDSVWV
jgi:hypothetical protein